MVRLSGPARWDAHMHRAWSIVLMTFAAALMAVCVCGAHPAYAADAYAVVGADGAATITHDSTLHENGSTGTSTDVPSLSGTWYRVNETTTGQNQLFPDDVVSNVTSVVFDDTCDPAAGGQKIAPASTSSMFFGCRNLRTIGNLDRLDPHNVVNSSAMFMLCESLSSLDLGDWSSNQSTNMSEMFYGCSSLTEIRGTAGLVTAHTTDMYGMFQSCYHLRSIDMSGWDTSNVTDMAWTFQSCYDLADFSGLNDCDLSHVTTFNCTFGSCSSLTRIPIFSTVSATDMFGMFSNCTSLTSVDLSRFDTSHVTRFRMMFSGCTHLTSVRGLDQIDTSSLTDVSEMFADCSSLPTISGLNKWDTSRVTNFSEMFSGCSSLNDPSLNFSTASATDMSSMFSGCASLTHITGFENWDLRNVGNFSSMFADCTSLTNVSIESPTPAATDMSGMFSGCTSLTSLDLRELTTGSVTTFDNMFRGCSSLSSIEGVEDFDTSSMSSMQWMFGGCRSLAKLDLHKYTCGSGANSLNGMFRGCDSLVDLDISGMDTRGVYNMGNLFSAPDPSDTTDYSNPDLNNVSPTPLHRLVLGPHWSFAGSNSYAPYQTTVLVTPATGEQTGPDGVAHRYLGTWGMDASTSPTQITTPSLLAAYQECAYPSDPSNSPVNMYSETHAWVWGEEQAYTLAYNANGGQNAPAPQVIYVNPTSSDPLGSWTVDASQPTRDRYTFEGWNTEADGSGTSYDANDEIPLDASVTSMTLYAQWSEMPRPVVPGGPWDSGNVLAGGDAQPQQGGIDGASANGSPSGDSTMVSNGAPQTGDLAYIGLIVGLLVIVTAVALIVAVRAHRHADVQGRHRR